MSYMSPCIYSAFIQYIVINVGYYIFYMAYVTVFQKKGRHQTHGRNSVIS